MCGQEHSSRPRSRNSAGGQDQGTHASQEAVTVVHATQEGCALQDADVLKRWTASCCCCYNKLGQSFTLITLMWTILAMIYMLVPYAPYTITSPHNYEDLQSLTVWIMINLFMVLHFFPLPSFTFLQPQHPLLLLIDCDIFPGIYKQLQDSAIALDWPYMQSSGDEGMWQYSEKESSNW